MSIALLAVRIDELQAGMEKIDTANSIIIDKLNRIEATVANCKPDPTALKAALTDAIALLGVPLNAPQR